MELQNEAEKMPANQQEGESRPDVPEASPEAKRAKQLEQVERALRDLAPHMEKFKDADKSALETHAHEQIAALEAELGEKLGQESVDLIHKNLVTEVLVRKESLQSTTDNLQQEKSSLEGEVVPAEVPLEVAVFAAKPIEVSHEDEGEEASANNSDHFEDEGDTTSEATVADRAEAMEDINESKVEETIVNLVKAPETILGNEQAGQQEPSEEKAVKILLEALGSRYNDPNVLVKRLMDVFVGYKVAWVHDRRVRPGLSEGAHKKMALEDTIKDIPVEESQLIEHLLQGDPQTTKGLTKGIVMKDYIGLIERKSHLASPEVDSEDGGAEAEAA